LESKFTKIVLFLKVNVIIKHQEGLYYEGYIWRAGTDF